MAGGLWMVTGAGAAAGLLGGAAPVALTQFGAASVKVELMKLQVNYRENILRQHLELRKAQAVLQRLALQRDQMVAVLHEERRLNDKNAARLRDIEAKVAALEDAIQWMRREVPDAP